jgi:hypothetical protein
MESVLLLFIAPLLLLPSLLLTVVLVVVGFAVLVVVVDQKIRDKPSVLHPKAVHVGRTRVVAENK